MKKIFLAALAVSFSLNSVAENLVDVSAEQIDAIRIHTTKHSTSAARKIATVKMSGLEGGCVSGVFFDSEENASTMSILLSAFVSKSDVRIAYEPNSTAPWGDSKYCALTYLDIK